jgi:DNA-binding NtrC family response regulator
VLDAFDAYPWPGNVRELEGEVVRAAALAQGPEVALSDISPEIRKPAPGAAVAGKGILHVLAGEKSRRAEEALLQAGGCQRGAARMLDMDPSSFRRMCRRLGLPLGPGAPELMDSGGTDERTAQRCQSRRRQPAADSLVQPGRVEPPAEGRR